jgi:hypothetical protein
MEIFWWKLLAQKPATTDIEIPTLMEKGWKLKQFHLSRLHAPNHWFFLDKFSCFLDQKFDISFFLVNFTKCWEKNNQHTWKLMFEKPFLGGAGGSGRAVWGWISVPHKRQVIHYFWQPCLLPKAPSSFPPSLFPFYLPPFTASKDNLEQN